MLVDPKNPYEVEQARELFETFIKKGLPFELKRRLPRRTNPQNAYLHVILGYFGSEYGCSMEEAKIDFFKRKCNKELFEREVVNKHGKTVPKLRSSKDLDTKEMTQAIERFRNWSASVAGIYLPSPNEEQFLLYCEKMIQENAEWI